MMRRPALADDGVAAEIGDLAFRAEGSAQKDAAHADEGLDIGCMGDGADAIEQVALRKFHDETAPQRIELIKPKTEI